MSNYDLTPGQRGGGLFCLAKVKLQFGGFDSWVLLDGRDFVLLF